MNTFGLLMTCVLVGLAVGKNRPDAPVDVNTAGSISFALYRTSNLGPVSQNTNVNYEITEVDTASAIEAATSFVVPVDGIYLINYKFHGNDVVVYLMKNAEIVSSAAAGDSNFPDFPVSSGASVVLDLVVGDTVFLVIPADPVPGSHLIEATANREISFTGCLLYQRI